MVLHLVAVTKLQLLAAVGHGHGAGQLLAALLGPFVLKLPMSRYAPRALGDVVFSCRLFLFRLGRIVFDQGVGGPSASPGGGGGGGGGGRWGRALRLVSGRWEDGRRLRGALPPPDEASLHVVSMLAL